MEKKFEAILKDLRVRKELSVEELALQLDLPVDVYEQIEAGTMVPDKDTLERMKEYFNVSFDSLLTGEHVNERFQDVKNQLVSMFVAKGLTEEEVKRVLGYMSEEAEKRSKKVFYRRM